MIYRISMFLGVVLVLLTSIAESIRFDLGSGRTKCIAEDIKPNSMTVGKYSVVNPNENHHSLPDSHKLAVRLLVRVSAASGNSYHYVDHAESGQFSFQAVEAGDYVACF